MIRRTMVFLGAGLLLACSGSDGLPPGDLLPSWNDGPAKTGIIEFVTAVIDSTSPSFVPEGSRLATFDNDGTLWVEQPIYTQLAFAFDRVKTLAPEHPEWATQQPVESVLKGDMGAVLASGKRGILEIVMATHAGMATTAFEEIVTSWLSTARHQRWDRPYTQLLYQPQLELLAYLRAKGFTTFIVSGGGIEFMRPWTEGVYGIPPAQVVGSTIQTEFVAENGTTVLERLPKIDFIDDKDGKPVGINKFIGRRPILAFGNSDGDFQMLQYTTTGSQPGLGLIVHHDDAEREYAYDRDSDVGRLNRALDDAEQFGWVVVSMKNDWNRIFPFEDQGSGAGVAVIP